MQAYSIFSAQSSSQQLHTGVVSKQFGAYCCKGIEDPFNSKSSSFSFSLHYRRTCKKNARYLIITDRKSRDTNATSLILHTLEVVALLLQLLADKSIFPPLFESREEEEIVCRFKVNDVSIRSSFALT